ncbi:hypothetical protein WISP_104404 [Willisornis vidua]|uniref:Uncharacterized protein n=1 Tax=Willisornis vidua TaxID=1566151 RepID=A0ABQ9D3J2_9PASS|nr:hypothetical protein WISP_104404 [Willisornis vidua]
MVLSFETDWVEDDCDCNKCKLSSQSSFTTNSSKYHDERATVARKEWMNMMTPESSSDPIPDVEELLFLHNPSKPVSKVPLLNQRGSADRTCMDKLIEIC